MTASDPTRPHHLRDWNLRRSGKSMTLTGIEASTGERVKLTDIGEVNVQANEIIATHASGKPAHRLAPSN